MKKKYGKSIMQTPKEFGSGANEELRGRRKVSLLALRQEGDCFFALRLLYENKNIYICVRKFFPLLILGFMIYLL